uniref:SRCR domain-containing protein n=1 Tax=Mastacembelus armatus TaxID=205130 RepID=A0A3Q3LSQ2_9TELE
CSMEKWRLQCGPESSSVEAMKPVRLVGGNSRCAGTLEVKHKGDWRTVDGYDWTLKTAAVACRELDCGSAVSVVKFESVNCWLIFCFNCLLFLSVLSSVMSPDFARLVNGTSLCSGRLEVKSNQWWSSVCEADFDQRDAEVVCRELGCGAPLLLQGALYGEVEAPMWTREFQCGGHESALLDCRSSDSDRNTCSPGKAVGLTCSGRKGAPVRLVGGNSRCAGTLEVKHKGDWRTVDGYDWTLKTAAVVCRELDCGSAVSVGERKESSNRLVWLISPHCVESKLHLRDCVNSYYSSYLLDLTCSDSVRLVNGTSPCSGRLEVKSHQWWSSVCEADFDQRDAEVVCRELGCGAPLVLQGVLYGEVEAPMWTREFQCGGHESALLDCRSSDSDRNTCSPGKAVGLTCSGRKGAAALIWLVGGNSRCAGTLEVKHKGDWRTMDGHYWTLKTANVVCRERDCGSAVSVEWSMKGVSSERSFIYDCVQFESRCSGVGTLGSWELGLVNGTSLCSGRLEVKSNQSNQWWSSVCEADFDQRDAEVVCRELGCGAPLVLQGALYGEVEAPMWTREFQCGGNESALLDCRSSDSDRNTCSPVCCFCSEPVRLVGGNSRCAGTLEVKHKGDWRPVFGDYWTLKTAAVACRQLDCGSAVSVQLREESSFTSVWQISPYCFLLSFNSLFYLLMSPASVRLVNGTSLCSGRLEVKSNQSNQWWSSVCEADFDQQDAEVVCRELGCGAPLVLQGALYGEVEAPMWTREFQCGGHESALLDCRSSDSDRNTCSPGKAVGLTCSGRKGAAALIWFICPVRLVGGNSRCAGTLEVKHKGDWRPVGDDEWTLKTANVACRQLDCGSAVSIEKEEFSVGQVWTSNSKCVQSGSALRDCVQTISNKHILNLNCSGKLISDITYHSNVFSVSSSVIVTVMDSIGLNCKA